MALAQGRCWVIERETRRASTALSTLWMVPMALTLTNAPSERTAMPAKNWMRPLVHACEGAL
jgi:hypothetical protein